MHIESESQPIVLRTSRTLFGRAASTEDRYDSNAYLAPARANLARSVSSLALCALAAMPASAGQAQPEKSEGGRVYAQANLTPLAQSGVNGQVTFRHAGEFIWIEGSVKGLKPGKHGIHVHEGTSCAERGGHFNPEGTRHGAPDQPHDMRHIGDLGNLVALESGIARMSRIDALTRLDGPHSVVGRVLVVHQGEDDYTSQPAGSSGDQIACGIIQRMGK
jgi:superoxide dismutase, Cu-Zn family